MSARSGPLSWHVQPNRVPPSTPRVARDQCLLAPRCTRRRREHAHASAGQLPVSADPHLHQVAAHLHVYPQVEADGIADLGGTPRSTAQAFLCRRVVTSLGACRVDPGPSPTVPGWRLANRPTAERGYGSGAPLTAGPRRWRCTAEERSVVHGSKPVRLIMRSHGSLAAFGCGSGWRRQCRARRVPPARGRRGARPPFSDQPVGHGRGE